MAPNPLKIDFFLDDSVGEFSLQTSVMAHSRPFRFDPNEHIGGHGYGHVMGVRHENLGTATAIHCIANALTSNALAIETQSGSPLVYLLLF